MAAIQRVAQLARQTFSKTTTDKTFKDNFARLKRLITQITAADVNFNHELVKTKEIFKPESGKAPVTYVALWEDEWFSMGIFVLKNGVTLPLHDHPGMHGLCKVICGTVSIQRYSAMTSKDTRMPSELAEKFSNWQIKHFVQPVIADQVTQYGPESEPCCLTPSEWNYHQITAVNGPAAFLDVLAPPYNNETRTCHYFKDITPVTKTDNSTSGLRSRSQQGWLMRIPQPLEFWCDCDEYAGPVINQQTFSKD